MRYNQGDVVWVNFPFTDGVGAKRRPALVISGTRVNKHGDYLLMQITSKSHDDGLSYPLSEADYSEKPLEIISYLRLHKIFILSEALIIGKASTLSRGSFEAIKTSFIKQIL